MSCELIDTIYVKGLQQYDQCDKLNPVQILIKSNTVIADLTRYKNHKYSFLVDRLLFSSAITNDTNTIFITCNGLNEAKTALAHAKIFKVLGVINIMQIRNWELVKGECK